VVIGPSWARNPVQLSPVPEQDPKITLVVKDATLQEIAQKIQAQTGYLVSLHGQAARSRCSILLKNETPLSVALTQLCGERDLEWWVSGEKSIAIADFATFASLVIQPLALPEALEFAAERYHARLKTNSDGTWTLEPISTHKAVRAGPPTYAPLAGAEHSPRENPSDPKVTLVFKQVPVSMLTMAMENQTGRTIKAVGPVADQRADILCTDMPLGRALDMLTAPNDWLWWEDTSGNFTVCSPAWFKGKIMVNNPLTRAVAAIASFHGLETETQKETGVIRLVKANPAEATTEAPTEATPSPATK
jgi:hypothetical protein